jgi:hypothetical protein
VIWRIKPKKGESQPEPSKDEKEWQIGSHKVTLLREKGGEYSTEYHFSIKSPPPGDKNNKANRKFSKTRTSKDAKDLASTLETKDEVNTGGDSSSKGSASNDQLGAGSSDLERTIANLRGDTATMDEWTVTFPLEQNGDGTTYRLHVQYSKLDSLTGEALVGINAILYGSNRFSIVDELVKTSLEERKHEKLLKRAVELAELEAQKLEKTTTTQ